jgi:hypothetical protein
MKTWPKKKINEEIDFLVFWYDNFSVFAEGVVSFSLQDAS